MKKYIISTSINAPTDAITQFASLEDWITVVVGDQKTPKDYKLDRGVFLSLEDQEKLSQEFDCIKYIPFNCIQRRNIGFLYALKQGADIIASVDDDNMMYNGWMSSVALTPGFKCTGDMLTSDLVCDVLYHHEEDLKDIGLRIWCRGFPPQLLRERYKQINIPIVYNENGSIFQASSKEVLIMSGLIDSDPDIDAICRIANGPHDISLRTDKEYLIDPKCFTPVNTQNTMFNKEIAPAMCLPINVGRLDDIWMFYIGQRIMRELDKSVLFTGPTVYQERNEHDFVKDLEQEMIGNKYTLDFLKWLDKTQVSGITVLEMYSSIVEQLDQLHFYPVSSIEFQKAWINDMKKLGF